MVWSTHADCVACGRALATSRSCGSAVSAKPAPMDARRGGARFVRYVRSQVDLRLSALPCHWMPFVDIPKPGGGGLVGSWLQLPHTHTHTHHPPPGSGVRGMPTRRNCAQPPPHTAPPRSAHPQTTGIAPAVQHAATPRSAASGAPDRVAGVQGGAGQGKICGRLPGGCGGARAAAFRLAPPPPRKAQPWTPPQRATKAWS